MCGSIERQPHWVPMATQGQSQACRSTPNLPPGALGALAVGGLCLLACFLFTDFPLLTVLATESLLMGGWVLAVRHEILRRISKHSNLAGFTHPRQQGRAASPQPTSWFQEAVPWAHGLSSPSLKRALRTDPENPGRGWKMTLLPSFPTFSAYLAL